MINQKTLNINFILIKDVIFKQILKKSYLNLFIPKKIVFSKQLIWKMIKMLTSIKIYKSLIKNPQINLRSKNLFYIKKTMILFLHIKNL